MGLPFIEDNAIGYTNARLSTLYSKFVNKTYLLVHGTLDDNVHYQQSMAFIRQLELSDIPFEQIVRFAKYFFLFCVLKINFISFSLSFRHIRMKTILWPTFEGTCIIHWNDSLINVLEIKLTHFLTLIFVNKIQ